MAYQPVQRDLSSGAKSGATIRLAKRDAFEARSAVSPPSATGGAPRVNPQTPETLPMPGSNAAPATGLNPNMPTPLVPSAPVLATPDDPHLKMSAAPQVPGTAAFWRMMEAKGRSEQPIVPFLIRPSNQPEEYNVLNQGLVDQLAQQFTDRADADPDWAERVRVVGTPIELAQRVVRQIQTAFELQSGGLSLPDQIYANRQTRDLYQQLQAMRERRNSW